MDDLPTGSTDPARALDHAHGQCGLVDKSFAKRNHK